jgi:hypothetical protein
MAAMSTIGTSLETVFDFSWQRFRQRLEGLTDEEYLWEPVRGCWSLRPGDGGTLVLDGDGGGGPPPEPVPFTTVAWRIGHLGLLTLRGFTARLFGDEAVAGAPFGAPLPGDAGEVWPYLDAGYQAWRAGMASFGEERWWSLLGPDWEPYEESNHVDLALHVLDEVVHHAAEVALLRDLYANRAGLRA